MVEENVSIPHPKPFKRVSVKYVFVDIVKFTASNRTDKAQAAIIAGMNSIVLDILKALNVSETERILLPTGGWLVHWNSKGRV